MLETAALHRYMDVGHDWAKHHAAPIAFLAGAIVATLVLGVAQPAVRLVRSSPAHPAGIDLTLAYAAPELPREWRWEVDAVNFDHMYRESSPAPRELDWISDPERRGAHAE